MTTPSMQTIEGWSESLTRLEGLLDPDYVGLEEIAVVASVDRDPEAAPSADIDERFRSYEEMSLAASLELTTLSVADVDGQRATSALAAGDFEAALVAIRLAEQLEPSGATASFSDEVFVSPVDDLTAELRQFRVSGGQAAPANWPSELQTSLNTVAQRSIDGMIDLAGTAAVSAIGAGIIPAAGQILGGQFADAMKAIGSAVSWLKRKAVELIRKGLDKVVQLFGDDVRDAIDGWIKNVTKGIPLTVVSAMTGLEATMSHWRDAATRGIDVTAKLSAVKLSEQAHLKHLTWAGRGVTVLGWVAPIVLATAALGPFAPVVAGVLALALAGWMFWAAWDNSRDVRRLV